MSSYILRRFSRHLSERGGHLSHAWVCVGHFVSPCYPDRFIKRKPRFARGILPDKRLRRQIDPGGLRPLHRWRPAPRAAAGNAERGSRQSRGRPNAYSFSTETSVALITANTASLSLRFIRSTEPVVIIDVTIPAAVRITTSDTTLSETMFSIVSGKRF
jgi:hypothetical protein